MIERGLDRWWRLRTKMMMMKMRTSTKMWVEVYECGRRVCCGGIGTLVSLPRDHAWLRRATRMDIHLGHKDAKGDQILVWLFRFGCTVGLTTNEDVAQDAQCPNVLLFASVPRSSQHFRCSKAVRAQQCSRTPNISIDEKLEAMITASRPVAVLTQASRRRYQIFSRP